MTTDYKECLTYLGPNKISPEVLAAAQKHLADFPYAVEVKSFPKHNAMSKQVARGGDYYAFVRQRDAENGFVLFKQSWQRESFSVHFPDICYVGTPFQRGRWWVGKGKNPQAEAYSKAAGFTYGNVRTGRGFVSVKTTTRHQRSLRFAFKQAGWFLLAVAAAVFAYWGVGEFR